MCCTGPYRQYPKQIRAEAIGEVAGARLGSNLNTPFRTLAGYIVGAHVGAAPSSSMFLIMMTQHLQFCIHAAMHLRAMAACMPCASP